MSKIGDRIGALIGGDPETKVLKYLGVGTYQGDETPPPEAGGFNIGLPCPKLVLDNGDVVYGCECWWGPETVIANQLDEYRKHGYTIVTTPIVEFRAEVAAVRKEAETKH